MTELERERRQSDERWLLALNSLQEVSGQYRELLKLVQNGFSTLSLENDAIRQRLKRLEADASRQRAALLALLILGSITVIACLAVAALLVYVGMRLFSVVI
jgi:hypothetical protein